MYGVNDVFDYESDRNNPRKNSLEGALEAREFHPVILRACLISGLISLPILIVIVPRWEFWLALAILMFFVVAYSAPLLRFKERPFLDSITSSIHFVGPMIVGMIAAGMSPLDYWPIVAAFFLWGMASHAFGAVQDVLPDRAGNLHSIATVIGARATVWLSALMYAAASILMIAQGGLLIIIGCVGILYVLNVAPYLGITDKTSARANRGWKRFLWINYVVGAVVTMCALWSVV